MCKIILVFSSIKTDFKRKTNIYFQVSVCIQCIKTTQKQWFCRKFISFISAIILFFILFVLWGKKPSIGDCKLNIFWMWCLELFLLLFIILYYLIESKSKRYNRKKQQIKRWFVHPSNFTQIYFHMTQFLLIFQVH